MCFPQQLFGGITFIVLLIHFSAFDIRDIDFHRHHFEERRQALKGELSNTGKYK